MTVTDAQLNEPTLAVVAAISETRGLMAFSIYPRSINTTRFMEFLKKLRKVAIGAPITVFLDNLAVHKTQAARQLAGELDIELIYNVPYAPQFNPIELVFAELKRSFLKLRLMKLTG